MLPVTVNIKLPARSLPGALHANNRLAADWGWQGLLAYGCHSLVMVVDPRTAQTIQALDKHKATVVKVKWARENYHHDACAPYSARLASGDASGKIVVWDVAAGGARCEIQEYTKPVQDMEWLWSQDASLDLLLAVHPPNLLVLWNADTGTKLWKKSYAENIISFSCDPFDPSSLALLTSEGMVFVHDFSPSRPPPSAGRKVYISSPSSSPAGAAAAAGRAPTGARRALNRVKTLITDEKPSVEGVLLTECIQMSYLPAHRSHMLLLYPREIVILDLEISQTVGIVAIERSGVPFLQVIPCRQRDALFCLHENGCTTLRVRRPNRPSVPVPAPADEAGASLPPHPKPRARALSQQVDCVSADVVYELRCQSDAVRVTKTVRPMALGCCPVGENAAAMLVSDGRLLVWELHATRGCGQGGSSQLLSPLSFCGALAGPCTPSLPDLSLDSAFGQCLVFADERSARPPGPQQEVSLRFLLTGLLSGLPPPPFVLRMCPPLTTKNLEQYQPLLAVGTSSGSVLVYHLTSGLLYKEFSVHTCEVRGIEWVSLTSFLSHASSTPNNMGLVRNELQLVDMSTGRSTPFRGERGNDEPPIDMIKISHLKQYLIVAFRDKPVELWDVRTGALLREMPKTFPAVTALEWSPSHNLRTLRKKQLAAREAMARQTSVTDGETGSLQPSLISLLQDAESKAEQGATVCAREHFVFTDSNGVIYHFTVEGTSVKEGARIPPDASMGSISSIAWKGDVLVLGDSDGNLNFWDLKAKLSRGIPTHRGWVRRLRFAPGKGNSRLLVLYNDGIEIWDTKEVKMVSSLRSGRSVAWRVLDVDWCTSDKAVLACEDGCVRVSDTALRGSAFRMEEQELTDALWCPYLLPPRAGLALKAILLHQPWDCRHTLQIDDIDYQEHVDVKRLLQEQLDALSNDYKSLLLNPNFSLLQRCLLTARLFGDESELHFWTVAGFYLQHHKRTAGLAGPSGDGLDVCYDLLCDNAYFQRWQLERVGLQEAKRATYVHTNKCADKLLLLGQTERAVQLLLETSAENAAYHSDSLKACLVSTLPACGAAQSTIKLVATNMIASGKLSEGVQLLCLIDKAADACRYLQTYGQWNQAAWLAKVRLGQEECGEVLKRWADHLCSPHVNQKSRAILVLLSLGCFQRVLDMLHSMRYFDRAALFLEACVQAGVLADPTDATRPLTESVCAEYGRYLRSLGLGSAAAEYAARGGPAGVEILAQLAPSREAETPDSNKTSGLEPDKAAPHVPGTLGSSCMVEA
ncbi:WD repeat-containing protein 11 isoform X1 [Petromyzon marinus]|uniref:WD repeat-containing protein 11 isoform X1 n=1 Tax=Petromyzon marinus TaxID=7757 RepID=UPI003F7274BF